MVDFDNFLSWLNYQKILKKRKRSEKMLLELNALTVTIHGRYMLTKICQDPDNGLPNEIKRMYWLLLLEAPVQHWAQWN